LSACISIHFSSNTREGENLNKLSGWLLFGREIPIDVRGDNGDRCKPSGLSGSLCWGNLGEQRGV